MKKLKYIFLLPAILVAAVSGCKDNLTETTFSDLSVQTYKYTDAYSAMGITYANLRGLFSHTSYYALQETSSDELVMPANSSGWEDAGIYKRIHLHTWNSENPQMGNMWQTLYSGVINANRIIEQLENGAIPTSPGTTKASLVSEMRVVRAFYYWLICDNFGNAPLVTSVSTELPSTTARRGIYDFIVKEVNESLPNLSENNDKLFYGRFNKWGAKALLANIYLNAEIYSGTAQWAEALKQCDDIIASGKYSLEANFKNPFKAQNQNSNEILFAVPFDQTQGKGFFIEMFSWHGALKDKVNMQATPWGSGSAQGIPQFINTYDPSDTRIDNTWLRGPQFKADGSTPIKGAYDKNGQQLNFVNSLPDGLFTSETEGLRMNKFEVANGTLADLDNDFPFFRYSEVLLMKAECLLRTGNGGAAAQVVTQVRSRDFADAGKATVTAAQLEADSKYKYGFIQNYAITDPGNQSPVKFGGMLDELGYEFAWEAHRRRDDIRFGVFTTKSWLSHKPNGAHRIIFPIPQLVLNSNPKLTQIRDINAPILAATVLYCCGPFFFKANENLMRNASFIDQKPVPNRARILVFKVLAVCLPFLFLLLIEGLLRWAGYGDDLSLFVPDSQYKDCLVVNPALSKRYFTEAKNATIGNFEPFKKVKPMGTKRIFVLGESTTIGFPYMHNGSFHRMLRYRLLRMYPDVDFEIINLSLTAVNSITVRDIAPELVSLQPDAVMIYCGHNEFYGALGAASSSSLGRYPLVVRTVIKLRQYRLFQLLFNGYQKMFGANGGQNYTDKSLMERMAAEHRIELNSAVFNRGIDQFRTNIGQVCAILMANHIPVLLSNVVSNEKDLSPFIDDDQKTAMKFYSAAKRAYLKGNFDRAKKLFVGAKQCDLLRFRAPEEINREISMVTKKYPLVTLVDSKKVFESYSPEHILGKETLLEHVHPNLRGYNLIAGAFFDKLQQILNIDKPTAENFTLDQLYTENPVTQADSVFGAYTILLLRRQWPFNQHPVITAPKTFVERIGYRMAVSNLSWKDAMNEMMAHYEKNRDVPKMLKIAEAVSLEYPYDPGFYAYAGRISLYLADLRRARNYLCRAFRLQPSLELAQDIFKVEIKSDRLDEALEMMYYADRTLPGNEKIRLLRTLLQKMIVLKSQGANISSSGLYELAQGYEKLGAPGTGTEI